MKHKFTTALLSSRWSGLAIIFLTYIYLITLSGQAKSVFLWISNATIILISCLLIYFDPAKSVSIVKVVGIFFLLFFGISPILEYKTGTLYWGGGEMSEYDYIYSNILIIFSLLLYLFVYSFTLQIKKHESVSPGGLNLFRLSFRNARLRRLFFVAFVFLLVVFGFNDFNVFNLITRGGDLGVATVVEVKAAGLIVNNFIRPFCFSALIFAVFFVRNFHFANRFWLYLLIPIAVFACFPVALPRFAVAALYIPLALVLFPGALRSKFMPANIFVLSFVSIFPLLDSFRYVDSDFSIDLIRFNFDFFIAGHFDAYQNFTRTVSLGIVTYGQQLIGAILFWFPRAFWEGKPIGSGELLAAAADLGLSNISQSLPAEGYINFGIFGIFLFIGLSAYGSAVMDAKFWYREMRSGKTLFSLYYFQLIGLTVFIFRGDLVNAVAYTSGFLSSMFLVCYVFKLRILSVR